MLSEAMKDQSKTMCAPSNRLLTLVLTGMKHLELEEKKKEQKPDYVAGIDLDFQSESVSGAPQPADYQTVYVTSHKEACRTGTFNKDGTLVATGSVDTSIKILDVDKMIAKSIGEREDTSQPEGNLHPVIRTLYDHTEEVTCIVFHPNEQILVSGSADSTVKIFDYTKASAKKAVRSIQETHRIQSLSMHPTGDYVLVATQHPTLRLYDINTSQCFVGSNPDDQHQAAVNMVCYNSTGTLYASCSDDGIIKVWDGVSSRVINQFIKAHDVEVCSITFSKNGKYLLTSGKDASVKLWELSMSRCLIAYTGGGTSGKPVFNTQACFNHTEDFVLFPDEKTTSLCAWDSRTAERKNLLALGHNQIVRWITHSPDSAAFISCSDDFRARFWYKRPDDISN